MHTVLQGADAVAAPFHTPAPPCTPPPRPPALHARASMCMACALQAQYKATAAPNVGGAAHVVRHQQRARHVAGRTFAWSALPAPLPRPCCAACRPRGRTGATGLGVSCFLALPTCTATTHACSRGCQPALCSTCNHVPWDRPLATNDMPGCDWLARTTAALGLHSVMIRMQPGAAVAGPSHHTMWRCWARWARPIGQSGYRDAPSPEVVKYWSAQLNNVSTPSSHRRCSSM